MLRHPYLAAAVASLPLVDGSNSEWCATAATDGYHVIVNPAFFEPLTDAEAEFVLAHEILHCILGHADRRGERDSQTWNMAADYATNQTLVDFGFTFPAVGLYSKAYAGQPAETIYETLREQGPREGSGELDPDGGHKHGLASAGEALRRALSPEQLRRLVAAGSWDIQLDPSGHEGSELRGGDMPTELERRRLREGLADPLRSALHGRAGGLAEEEISASTRRTVAWQDLLARFVTGIRRSDYRSYPFNKKHVARGIYLPSLGAPGPQRIVVAIDTSGSIDGEIAALLLAEVDGLRAATECQLTVIQCDDKVRVVADFDPWEDSIFEGPGQSMQLVGRGGTDFVPVFDWLESDQDSGDLAPDALIYLTDGYGAYPKREPRLPVMWVVTADGMADDQIPFGSVIRLPRS